MAEPQQELVEGAEERRRVEEVREGEVHRDEPEELLDFPRRDGPGVLDAPERAAVVAPTGLPLSPCAVRRGPRRRAAGPCPRARAP